MYVNCITQIDKRKGIVMCKGLPTLQHCIAAKRGGSGKYTPCKLISGLFFFWCGHGGHGVESTINTPRSQNKLTIHECEGDV